MLYDVLKNLNSHNLLASDVRQTSVFLDMTDQNKFKFTKYF